MKKKQLAFGGFILFLILLCNGCKFAEEENLSEKIEIGISETKEFMNNNYFSKTEIWVKKSSLSYIF